MGRIEQSCYPVVHKRGRYYAAIWDGKTALSAGIIALDMLTPQQREVALAIAKGEASKEGSQFELLSPQERQIIEAYRRDPHVYADRIAELAVVSAVTDQAAPREKTRGRTVKSG
jgi:predicted ATPase